MWEASVGLGLNKEEEMKVDETVGKEKGEEELVIVYTRCGC